MDEDDKKNDQTSHSETSDQSISEDSNRSSDNPSGKGTFSDDSIKQFSQDDKDTTKLVPEKATTPEEKETKKEDDKKE